MEKWGCAMNNETTKKISAIFRNEKKLEKAITELTAETLALHEVSVQGSAAELKERFGKEYIKPETLQKIRSFTPKKEPFMHDDFGWLLGFSFSIPFFIGIVVGLFTGGDLTYYWDNLLYGVIGGIVGGGIGYLCMQLVKKRRFSSINKQEKAGGFVLWAISSDNQQEQAILAIIHKYGGEHIKIEED